MAQPDVKDPNAHPTVLLLPWYVTDALGEHERKQVEEHLATCAQCRAELAELNEMRGNLRDAFASERAPSSAAYDAVQSRISKPKESRREVAAAGLLERFSHALRWLLVPKWAPAAALVLIVAQMGTLAWLTQRAPDNGDVTTRGLPSNFTQLMVTFDPDATEKSIRDLLLELHARIVAGPSRDGAYAIELLTNDPQHVEEKLAALRARSGVVRSAERVQP